MGAGLESPTCQRFFLFRPTLDIEASSGFNMKGFPVGAFLIGSWIGNCSACVALASSRVQLGHAPPPSAVEFVGALAEEVVVLCALLLLAGLLLASIDASFLALSL
jgi:hypothetical protein